MDYLFEGRWPFSQVQVGRGQRMLVGITSPVPVSFSVGGTITFRLVTGNASEGWASPLPHSPTFLIRPLHSYPPPRCQLNAFAQ